MFIMYLSCEYITLQHKNKKEKERKNDMHLMHLSQFYSPSFILIYKHNKPKWLVLGEEGNILA